MNFYTFMTAVGLPVLLLGMVLAYKLLKLRLERRIEPQRREQTKVTGTVEGLAERARELNRRIENLEEIIYDQESEET